MAIELYQSNNILQVRCKGTIFGERFELLQHFRCKENNRTSLDIATVIRSDFLNEFRSILCSTTRFDAVGVCRIVPGPKTVEEIIPITALTGASNAESMPHQIAYLWKVRTGGLGPKAKGRVYFPGVPQVNFIGGGWSFQAISTMNSVRGRVTDILRAGGSAGTIEWGVWSEASAPKIFRPMVNIDYSLYPATMRSRRPQQP